MQEGASCGQLPAVLQEAAAALPAAELVVLFQNLAQRNLVKRGGGGRRGAVNGVRELALLSKTGCGQVCWRSLARRLGGQAVCRAILPHCKRHPCRSATH